MLKVGINGFGRIGRTIFRINEYNPVFEITAINDIDPLIENHAYLANYDSVYGPLKNKVSVSKNKKFIKNGEHNIAFYSKGYIDEIPWKENDVDIVIDSSGIGDNVVNSYKLFKQGVKKVIITHSPNNSVDHTIILGANENSFEKSKHNIISSSICDANACAPVLKIIDEEFFNTWKITCVRNIHDAVPIYIKPSFETWEDGMRLVTNFYKEQKREGNRKQ